MNIFIGTQEIANMIYLYAEGFKKLGHKVTTCAWPHPFYKNVYDYDLSLPKWLFYLSKFSRIKPFYKIIDEIITKYNVSRKRKILEKIINEIDVFIFIIDGFTAESMFDYKYIKSKNKKIVSLFCGTEVRDWDAFSKAYKINIDSIEKNSINNKLFNNKLFRLRKNEFFSDAIYSIPDQSILGIRPYYENKIPFISNKHQPLINNRDIPKIVHIPSRYPTKGTIYIERAVEELRKQNIQFEFVIHKDLSNDQVIDILRDADILIDEVILFGPGTLGMEAISCGCALATKNSGTNSLSNYICNINNENIVDKLKDFILHKNRRIENIYKSIEVLKKDYNAESVCSKILTDIKIDPMDYSKHNFIPTYFMEDYILPIGHEVNEKNKLLTTNIIEKFNLANQSSLNRLKTAGLI